MFDILTKGENLCPYTFLLRLNNSNPENTNSNRIPTNVADPPLVISDAEDLGDDDLAAAVEASIQSNKATPSSYIDVVKVLQDEINMEEHFFLTTRRGAPMDRALLLWCRGRKNNKATNLLQIKYLGEDGIDSGAMAKEFFTTTTSQIANTMFPDGSPADSTHYVQNGFFRAAGEIVGASIAQGGPPPCFLDERVFNTLINPDVDLRSLNLEHLTLKEREEIERIKSNPIDHTETVLEHGYTGILDKNHIDDIVRSIVVSKWNRRCLYLREFKQGLKAAGFQDNMFQHAECLKDLFVKGKLQAVHGC